MISRTIKFIKSYLFHSPFFVIVYAVAFFQRNFSFRVHFYSHEEVRQHVLQGKSMIRIGDGEIHLMLGGDLSYEKYQREIESSLRESIKNYDDNAPYLLGINELVMDKKNSFLKEKNKFYLWLPMKVFYFMHFNKSAKYFDASLFYYDGVFDFIFKDYLKSKQLVVVTPKKNIEKMKVSAYHGKVVEYIEAAEPNPYSSYEKIYHRLSQYKGRGDVLVLLSCGPTSKVLAYDFCTELQCVDIGIGLEVLLGRKGLVSLLEM